MTINFNLLKNYIKRLETLEKLFLLYSKEEDNHLTLLLIKNKYKKIFKGKEYTKNYNEKYFKKKTVKVKNEINKIKNGFKENENIKNILWLIKNKKFIKKYFLMKNIKKLIKEIDLNLDMNLDENVDNDDDNKIDYDNVDDSVICLNCKIEIKFKLLKYHLKSKKHKKLSNGNDKIGKLVGGIKKGEEIIKMIKEL